MSPIEVRDAPELARFEAWVGDDLAGWLEYQLTDELAVLAYTEVDKRFEGAGVGGTLAREAFEEVRRRGSKALVVCPFVLGWIARHPEYGADLFNARPSHVTD